MSIPRVCLTTAEIEIGERYHFLRGLGVGLIPFFCLVITLLTR